MGDGPNASLHLKEEENIYENKFLRISPKNEIC